MSENYKPYEIPKIEKKQGSWVLKYDPKQKKKPEWMLKNTETKHTPNEMLNFQEKFWYPEKVLIKDIKKFENSIKNMKANTVYILDDWKGQNIKAYWKEWYFSDKIFPDKIEFWWKNPRKLDLRLDQSWNIQIGLNNQRQKLDINKYRSSFDMINKLKEWTLRYQNENNTTNFERYWSPKPIQMEVIKAFADLNTEIYRDIYSYEDPYYMEWNKLINLTREEYNEANKIVNNMRDMAHNQITLDEIDKANLDKDHQDLIISFKFYWSDEWQKYMNIVLKWKSQNIDNIVRFWESKLGTYEETIQHFKKEYKLLKSNYNFWKEIEAIKYVDPVIEQIVKSELLQKDKNYERHPYFVWPQELK